MRYQNILITGGTGKLGKALLASNFFKRKVFAPTHTDMDITNKEQVGRYFNEHEIDAIIHCAALINMKECETNPASAIKVNINGTGNLVEAALNKPHTRFVYISTDYVYPCENGPYSESDSAIPFTSYGWTKLGGECAARTIKDHCIVRTSFFNPVNIPYDAAPLDSFCSKIPISELAEAIIALLDSDFVGVINVGQERASLYEIFKKYKPSIQSQTLEEINRAAPIKRAKDSSLDVSLWNKFKALAKT
ncbi:MAG: sugar nucleotide-binding protein [Nanoarchaeota archaeon]